MRPHLVAKQTARLLRRQSTQAEKWDLIRNRRISGKKFVRQHPILFDHFGRVRFVVVDAYCAEHRLIVEVDGGIHEQQKEYDEYRSMLVEKQGYHVIRFRNEDLSDSGRVVTTLKGQLSSLPSLFQREGTKG
jgi:very-short-patch-repair endonuclease